MTVSKYGYYNISTGFIENIISCEDKVAPLLTWPEGHTIVYLAESNAAGIGWHYLGGQFIPPAPIVNEPPVEPVVETPTVTPAVESNTVAPISETVVQPTVEVVAPIAESISTIKEE